MSADATTTGAGAGDDGVDLAGLREMGRTPPLREYLAEIHRRREFLVTFPTSELRAQNQNSLFGGFWHLLNPLLLAAVFYLVFGVILDQRLSEANYVGFLVIGVFVFTYTQKSIMAGTRTIVANMRLIQSLSFPRVLLPISATVTETIAHGYAIVAMLGLVVLTGERPSPVWLALPLVVAGQALFNLGLAMLSARATFHFRDAQQLLPYVLRLWLYLSGVFFGAEQVPAGLPRRLFLLNPVFNFIEFTRELLLHDRMAWGHLALGASVGAVVVVLGFFFFRASETEYGRG